MLVLVAVELTKKLISSCSGVELVKEAAKLNVLLVEVDSVTEPLM